MLKLLPVLLELIFELLRRLCLVEQLPYRGVFQYYSNCWPFDAQLGNILAINVPCRRVAFLQIVLLNDTLNLSQSLLFLGFDIGASRKKQRTLPNFSSRSDPPHQRC